MCKYVTPQTTAGIHHGFLSPRPVPRSLPILPRTQWIAPLPSPFYKLGNKVQRGEVTCLRSHRSRNVKWASRAGKGIPRALTILWARRKRLPSLGARSKAGPLPARPPRPCLSSVISDLLLLSVPVSRLSSERARTSSSLSPAPGRRRGTCVEPRGLSLSGLSGSSSGHRSGR